MNPSEVQIMVIPETYGKSLEVSRSGGNKVWMYQCLDVSRSGETMGLERQNYRKAKFSLLSQFKVL